MKRYGRWMDERIEIWGHRGKGLARERALKRRRSFCYKGWQVRLTKEKSKKEKRERKIEEGFS